MAERVVLSGGQPPLDVVSIASLSSVAESVAPGGAGNGGTATAKPSVSRGGSLRGFAPLDKCVRDGLLATFAPSGADESKHALSAALNCLVLQGTPTQSAAAAAEGPPATAAAPPSDAASLAGYDSLSAAGDVDALRVPDGSVSGSRSDRATLRSTVSLRVRGGASHDGDACELDDEDDATSNALESVDASVGTGACRTSDMWGVPVFFYQTCAGSGYEEPANPEMLSPEAALRLLPPRPGRRALSLDSGLARARGAPESDPFAPRDAPSEAGLHVPPALDRAATSAAGGDYVPERGTAARTDGGTESSGSVQDALSIGTLGTRDGHSGAAARRGRSLDAPLVESASSDALRTSGTQTDAPMPLSSDEAGDAAAPDDGSTMILCGVCFLGFASGETFVRLGQCGCYHICVQCARRYFEREIRRGRVFTSRRPQPQPRGTLARNRQPPRGAHVKCPLCPGSVERDVIVGVLGADSALVRQFDRFAFQAAVDADPHACWCPSPDCDTAVYNAPDRAGLSQDAARRVQCPTCQLQFCFDCRAPSWHEGLSCRDFAQHASKDERRFRKYASKKTRLCPNPTCAVRIEKVVDGSCNHMICSHCQTEFCWLCGKSIPPYGHFDRDNIRGCPGLQFKSDKYTRARRVAAQSLVVGRYAGRVLLAATAVPVIVALSIPLVMYLGVRHVRRRRRASETWVLPPSRRRADDAGALDDNGDWAVLQQQRLQRLQEEANAEWGPQAEQGGEPQA